MSDSRVKLQAALARSRYGRGESLTLDVEVHNRDPQAPLSVPVPFAPASPEVSLVVRTSGAPAPVTLGAASSSAPHRIALGAGEVYSTQIALDRLRDFDPGAYTVEVRWTHAHGEAASDPVAFEIVAVERLTLAFDPGAFEDPPSTLHTVCAMSGEAFGVVFERSFSPAIDDKSLFTPMSTSVRAAGEHPIARVIPVLGADESRRWVAWVDATGLRAKSGVEVEDAAVVAWAAQPGVHVIAPAIEDADHALWVYAVRGEPHELVAVRFGPPEVIVEPPEGPDDWDDEALIPGPVGETVVEPAEHDSTEVASTLVRADDGTARLVIAIRGLAASALVYVLVGEPDTFAPLPGHPLGGNALAAYVDEHGDVIAAVVVTRSTEGDNPATEVGVALVRFKPTDAPEVSVRWMATLSAEPAEAAVAFSWVATERPYWRCVVRGADGAAWIGDSRGAWSVWDVPHEPLTPLALITCAADAQVAAVGARNASLVRAP